MANIKENYRDTLLFHVTTINGFNTQRITNDIVSTESTSIVYRQYYGPISCGAGKARALGKSIFKLTWL